MPSAREGRDLVYFVLALEGAGNAVGDCLFVEWSVIPNPGLKSCVHHIPTYSFILSMAIPIGEAGVRGGRCGFWDRV